VKFIVKLVAVFVLGLFTAPPFAEAQQTGKVWRIGYLAVAPFPDLDDAFKQGLRERGYVEGQNLIIAYRFADGVLDRLPGLATELVGLGVDVIVALTTEGVRAARQATRTIPIVMPFSIDPVGAGLISSLARPGGNITGLSWPIDVLAGKRVQLVKELVPTVSRVAVLRNPTFQPSGRILRWTEAAAHTLGLSSQVLEVQGSGDLEGALRKIDKGRVTVLYVIEDPLTYELRRQIADLAAKNRLPSISASKEWVEAGGLMSYGANYADSCRRAATFVDKILKGAKPADLPVEEPTKFELVINLKTAKAIGVTIPQSLLLRADQVIE